MIKSYKLKLYPNKQKAKELNRLLSYWKDQVNHKIGIFWKLESVRGSYCPTNYALGGRLKRDSSTKAWTIVKTVKKNRGNKPILKKDKIDLNEFSAYIIKDFKTIEFDIWFNIICLNKHKRLKIPAKKTVILNEALKKGILKKSFVLKRIDNDYYIFLFVEFKKLESNNKKFIGIDVGLNNAIVLSNGKILGKEIKGLRIKTKWRKYKKGISAVKQGLNKYAKQIIKKYPNTDFVVEQLLFRGKKGKSKKFRRNNKNWAYNHLSNRLEQLSKVEGFRLIKVNPAYSSQKCPMCEFTDKANRQGEVFLCKQCGYSANADYVGAKNIVERCSREHSSPKDKGGI